MAFDATPGGDPRGPWCKSCKQPIEQGQPSARVHFDHDPHELSGLYHQDCSRPYVSLMRVLNMRFVS
ncbi:MAG: hypothetical protein ABUS48_01540 [Pseudomonadota bacterium]